MLLALLVAFAAPASAQVGIVGDAEPSRARWDIQMIEGVRYLRATAGDGEGPAKFLFLCNNQRRLVAMAMIGHASFNEIASTTEAVAWTVDGRPQPPIGRAQAPPLVMNQAVITLTGVDEPLYRQILAAGSVGFAWLHDGGQTITGFQIRMTEGREQLMTFARECDAEFYR